MTIEQVGVADVLASEALIAEYAAECSIPAIGEIDPQHDIYALIEKSGIMRGFMVFDGDAKVGFAIVLMPIIPHYGKKVATIESLFISKGCVAGRELMRTIEAFAAEAGCVGILYSAPTNGRLERLLEASKPYQKTNSVFFRRLA